MLAVQKLKALKDRHAKLDLSIEKETGRPSSNPELLRKWKREKLKIKDIITALSSRKAATE